MRPISHKRHRFPQDIIGHAVWLYFRFTHGLRDVEELLAQRGLEVSYETIRCWTQKFGRESGDAHHINTKGDHLLLTGFALPDPSGSQRLAAREGLEPPTLALGKLCSILLSYRAARPANTPGRGRFATGQR